MPHPWALVDSSFPTLREGDSPRNQIAALVDYMMILTEALKYQLENLDTNNWNTAALDGFQLDTTKDVSEQIASVAEQLKLLTEMVSAMKTRLTAAESAVGYLEAWQEEAQQELDDSRDQLGNVQADVAQLQQLVRWDEEGNILIGAEGETVKLVGTIYINEKLVE